MDHVSEVAYWILSAVCVEAASVQHLGVRSLDAVNFLLVDQRPGVFIRLIDCWVSSELSGVNALLLRSIRCV